MNQLGYTPTGQKIDRVSGYDAAVSGERVLTMDFTDLQMPGRYYLSVDAYQIEDLPLFTIGENVYSDSNGNWTTNEHTICWNSALVFHAALANQMSQPGAAPMFVEPTAVFSPPTAVFSPPTAVFSPPTAVQPEAQLIEEVVTESVTSSENPVVQQLTVLPELPPQSDEKSDGTFTNNLMLALIIIGVILIIVVIACTAVILHVVKRA